MSKIVAYEVSSDSGDDASDSASEEEYIPPASRLPSLQPPAEEAGNISDCSSQGEHLESRKKSCPVPNSANDTVPPKDSRETYSLKDNQLPQEMRVFLKAVEDFFTRSVNLERQKRAIKKSTFRKVQERLTGKFFVKKPYFTDCDLIKHPRWCFSRNVRRLSDFWLQNLYFLLGYLGFLNSRLHLEMKPEVFLRVSLIEKYLHYLAVRDEKF